MKYNKYIFIIFTIFMMTIGIKNVSANAIAMKDNDAVEYYSSKNIYSKATCYYESNDLKAFVYFHYVGVGKEYVFWGDNQYTLNGDVTAITYGDKTNIKMTGLVMNTDTDYKAMREKVKFERMLLDVDSIKQSYHNCPKYLVFGEHLFGKNEGFVTNDASIAQAGAADAIWGGYYAPNVSKEQFLGQLSTCGDDCLGVEVAVTCKNHALFGDPNDEGEYDPETGKEIRPASVAYLINEVLGIVKIAVPILLVVLGIIDIAKAVIASKEDQMKEAQATFIKRLIAGVLVFLVPTFINIVMKVTDTAIENKDNYCTLEEIIK